ncbi:MAG: 5-formyltetrahydrofolate cyclo-ligase [Betaproteobacteria bacterium]|nr:5-formyltetrahydrofolate cyclo-ligase [Betaproteobacteria bacterium]
MEERAAAYLTDLNSPVLRKAKRAMRRRVLALRDSLAPEVRAARSAAIAARIAGLPSFVAAARVSLTFAYRSEWDTRPLIEAALATGKMVALPRVVDTTKMLELHVVRDLGRSIAPSARGIPEPLPELPRVAPQDIDWVLVPGLAFDLQRRRLGYGGGFYDRLLRLLAPGTLRVSGAFDLQIVEQVPVAAHDLSVDAIVTETRVLGMAAS